MLVMAVEMGIGSGTIYGLKDGIDAAFEGIDPNGSQSSTSCSDVSDLLIVMFSAVPYPGDVSVTATQSHPGSSYGLYSTSYPTVSSWASGSYGGGDVGSYSDNYTPQLSGTD